MVMTGGAPSTKLSLVRAETAPTATIAARTFCIADNSALISAIRFLRALFEDGLCVFSALCSATINSFSNEDFAETSSL